MGRKRSHPGNQEPSRSCFIYFLLWILHLLISHRNLKTLRLYSSYMWTLLLIYHQIYFPEMLLRAGLKGYLRVYTSMPPHCKSAGELKGLPFWSLNQKASSQSHWKRVVMQSREEEKHLWGHRMPLWTGS